VVAAILFPLLARRRDGRPHLSCQSNLKQVGLGVEQYAQDYGDYFPVINVNPVSTSVDPYPEPYGWADSLQPYLKSTRILQCPDEPTEGDTHPDGVKPNFTDYWFNTNLAHVNSRISDHPTAVIMLGDGNDGLDLTDARYNRNSFPLSWLRDQDSPAHRHLGIAVYAFTDGHVKALPPDQITTTQPTKTTLYTFATK